MLSRMLGAYPDKSVQSILRTHFGIRNHRRSSRFGHASIATTERYTAVDEDEIRAAMMAAIRGIAT
jgi:integrase/recombinase XerC